MSEAPLEISCKDVQAKLQAGESFCFVDCRESNEYAVAKIDQARLLPMSELADRVAELDDQKGKLVVIHCHHGGRSLRVARWLRQQGFAQATSMAGGIDEWSREIDPSVPQY